MTLILTLVTPQYVLQVSDRLVTRAGQEFDPASNKNLIYLAKNALVTIGYSGAAYLEGVPTDRWIAQRLWGQELPQQFAYLAGRAPRWLTVGESIEALRCGCEEASCRLPPQYQPQIVLAGWQWRPHRARCAVLRPILYEIRSSKGSPGSVKYETKHLPRYWHWERPRLFLVSRIPEDSPLSNASLAELIDRLRDAVTSPEVSRELLVATVRDMAKRSRVVGADCMCIFIPRLSYGIADASYVPADKPLSLVAEGREPFEVPATYTPWIVAPASVQAPCVLVGGTPAGLGPVTLTMRGPEAPGEVTIPQTGFHIQSLLSSQLRPPPHHQGPAPGPPKIMFSNYPRATPPSIPTRGMESLPESGDDDNSGQASIPAS